VLMTHTSKRTRLTVALAGHPPPLLIGADGVARQIGQHGTLLGVLDPISVTEEQAELDVGETLLLYTDGVPDAGVAGGEPLGEDGLVELCRRAPELSLAGFLEHAEHLALDRARGTLRDDIALLGARVLNRTPRQR
jgi:sigma-B regulation protein RsbU (phosphoserine phosphatase)